MDYYEELGLRRAATVQEIRRAYKVLARLVHPDGQADERVRDMAQRQMKRLNQILATLTNEQTRREYDAQIAAAAGATLGGPAGTSSVSPRQVVVPPGSGIARPIPWWHGPKPLKPEAESWLARLPEWTQPAVQNLFWILLALVLVCVGVWYAAQGKSEPADSARVVSAQDVRMAPLDDPRPERRDGGKEASNTGVEKTPQDTTPGDDGLPAAERSATEPAGQGLAPVGALSPRQTPSRKTGPQEALGVPPATPSTQEELSNTTRVAGKPEQAETVTAGATANTKALSLAGNWLYVPDPTEKSQPGVYPATYVELLLADERGRLSGRYRAQYKVPDRAVSPEVSFQLQGDAPVGTSAHLRWTSADGAKGEVEMTLVGPNLMNFTWWTTELGRHATLASGTAKLIRQQAR